MRKGIILAGGAGTRLYPVTKVVNKQLLPVYDKPMIYYPLSTLMLSGIKDILLISTPQDLPNYKRLLGNGTQFGIRLSYETQEKPDGLAQAFLIGEHFLDRHPCAMILGDNIFYGNGLKNLLVKAAECTDKATIFGYSVEDPSRFGVAEFDDHGKMVSIEEKPKNPKSNYAITGLYYYDENVADYAKKLKPSERNELEITDLNNLYLKEDKLQLMCMGRGFAWLDTGTFDSMLEAAQFVSLIEKRQGIKISVPEEIAYIQGWVDEKRLFDCAENYGKSPYGAYLKKVVSGKIKY